MDINHQSRLDGGLQLIQGQRLQLDFLLRLLILQKDIIV